jgi:iron(III) transport system permease protein
MSISLPAYPYLVISVIALAMLAPFSLVLYQSLLSAPFFDSSAQLGLNAYRSVLSDESFSIAFGTTLLLSAGMTLIAVPLGTGLAFLIARTDVPGRHWLDPLILFPIFIPGLVMGLGYMVALAPGGMLSEFFASSSWAARWNLYAFPSLVVIAGLAHVPYVYLYVSSTMRNLGGDAEQAARSVGAGGWKVAFDVTLPMAMPVILFATVLVFFFGFELLGLPLVLGDRQGVVVLSTYLYKLGNTLAAPPYQHMAVVIVIMAAIGPPLVFIQRALLTETRWAGDRQAEHLPFARFKLGLWRWPTLLLIALWLAITLLLPVAAIVLRSFIVAEGGGLGGWGALTLGHFHALLQHATAARSTINAVLMGAIGGSIAVAFYAALALTVHRWPSRSAQAVDYLVLMPRAIPGLAAGLVLLWVLVFVKPVTPMRETLVSVWLAYAVVWFGCGTQIARGSIKKLDPELEDVARTVGATQAQAGLDLTLPLMRNSVLAAWLLIFLMFVRDYSTAIYLIAPGNEITGPLLVSLWGEGSVDIISALSVVLIATLGMGALIVSRLGMPLYD